MAKTIYQENGFADRLAYLSHLSDEYNVDLEVVQAGAELLGEAEDFDGLVSMIQDCCF